MKSSLNIHPGSPLPMIVPSNVHGIEVIFETLTSPSNEATFVFLNSFLLCDLLYLINDVIDPKMNVRPSINEFCVEMNAIKHPIITITGKNEINNSNMKSSTYDSGFSKSNTIYAYECWKW